MGRVIKVRGNERGSGPVGRVIKVREMRKRIWS